MFSFRPSRTPCCSSGREIDRRRGLRLPLDHALLAHVVVEREHRIVFALRDRVVLVVVAAGAFQRQAEQRFAGGMRAVGYVLHAELFIDDPVLGIHHVVPVEARRDELLPARIRQQVAGELPGHELVVGLVGLEGLDHPVAPGPLAPPGVALVAVRVAVAGHVHPVAGHALAVAGRREEPVDRMVERLGANRRPESDRARPAQAADRSGRRSRDGAASRGEPGRTGERPRRSIAASVNRSIGLSGQSACSTSGGAGRSGRRNDQCDFHSAPCSIQRSISAISYSETESSESGGGICCSGVGGTQPLQDAASMRLTRPDGAAVARGPVAQTRPLPGRSAVRPDARWRPGRGT